MRTGVAPVIYVGGLVQPYRLYSVSTCRYIRAVRCCARRGRRGRRRRVRVYGELYALWLLRESEHHRMFWGTRLVLSGPPERPVLTLEGLLTAREAHRTLGWVLVSRRAGRLRRVSAVGAVTRRKDVGKKL